MLEKVTVVDRIEVVESGAVQVCTNTFIMENGKQITSDFYRHVIAPGDDYSAETLRVQAICAAVHTPEVIATYQAAQIPA
jgi:hypothetical protein